ncbi:alpha-(1,3)-fucosyltransferase C-like [Plodia interpunctella]|uniref:alpha-(1,3)-fucosyltransferase C-like n=1 Tax=Plodia interpunctella TaxID=58824 RepID=UPI002368CFD4|nr:alpha-(1,3)-fucosyltransferase C-like isoform X1 [Plodia interpunctella]
MRLSLQFAKITVFVSITAMFLLIYQFKSDLVYYNFNLNGRLGSSENNLKYILLWTYPKDEPLVSIGFKQSEFITRNCSYTNCFVTANRNYLFDYSKFHAIVFTIPQAKTYSLSEFPRHRSPDQKYVACSTESSHYYPICSNRLDNYFNWTWSYRLDSECRFGYIIVRDIHGNVIGPNKTMHWMKVEDMKNVSSELKNSLQSKTIAAAWFASNCFSKSKRELFVQNLRNELNKYNHSIVVYGVCGNKTLCPRRNNKRCLEIIKQTYYFYLAFENSFSEDYVTEKLLIALKNNAIPVVYGGANYTRFMPDGMYLNARTLGPKQLALQMDSLIKNPDKYADYFRWKNHYSYHINHESPETDNVCSFCKLLNDEKKFSEKSVVKNFRTWWDFPKFC